MQQSNSYIIIFAAILTVVIGGLLSMAAIGLKPFQKIAIELDTKKQILGAVTELKEGDDILKIFDQKIKSEVVGFDGNVVENMNPIDLNMEKEYKKAPKDRLYPVYKYMNQKDPKKVDSYIIALYGNGLWDKIWGYLAIAPDLNTVVGIALDHKGETPGLGARITTPEVQGRYKGKKILSSEGSLVSIEMMKGERNDPSLFGENQVDGMSGATLTGKGVNSMLKKYLNYYQAYFKKIKSSQDVATN